MPALVSTATGQWAVNGWRLIEAAKVGPGGADLSQGNFDASKWYAATVPGTVLTTLVDRGVYPDPAVGLNNLSIPRRWRGRITGIAPSSTRPPRPPGGRCG
ncbi:hypothetical protein GCM10020258_17690 [Sphingomonas yabuuchiae]